MRLSPKGLQHLKSVEGLRLTAYWDRKQWSIGYGTKSRKGEVIDEAEAERRLLANVRYFEKCVHKYITVPLLQPEFDALVSWTYNVGCGALRDSTLRRVLNRGKYKEVPKQLMRWHIPRSIISRRKKEVRLWKSDLFLP